MKKTIYETNYNRLVKLGIVTDEQISGHSTSKASGYMDLVVERVEMLDNFNDQNCKAISLAHYFKQNGDMCQDPEMVVLIYPALKMAEAFSFQQAIPPIYQEVFDNSFQTLSRLFVPDAVYLTHPCVRTSPVRGLDPEPGKVYPRLKKDLNAFLRQWLINLINQGHGKEWTKKP